MENSPTDLAWAAGFFDGEGCVSIRKNEPRVISLEVKVGQVDIEPLEKLKGMFGGRLHNHTYKQKNWSRSYVWTVSCREAVGFLKQILPYIVRPNCRMKIELALEFQAQKKNIGQSKERHKYHEKQLEYYEKMKSLNKRGVNHGVLENRLA